MKILQASEQYFVATGLITPDSKCSTLIKAFLINFCCLFFMGPFLCGASSAYVYYNIDNIGESANAIMIVVGSFMCFNKYLCLRLYTESLKKLMKSFQEFVDQGPRHFIESGELLVHFLFICRFLCSSWCKVAYLWKSWSKGASLDSCTCKNDAGMCFVCSWTYAFV